MPRLPAIRISYTNDANYLFRLVNAIERDSKRPLEWRKKMIAAVQSLAVEFTQAPEPQEKPLLKSVEKRREKRAS
jgi:hypothetical protein